MPAKREISLLPDEENPNSPLSRLLRWLTTVGRFIIVFTELLVISAFLSRFWLDRKNSDLSEILRQQKAILESTKEFEKSFTLLQQKLKVIDDFYTTRPNYVSQINSLVRSTPPDIFFTSVLLDRNDQLQLTCTISASALNHQTVQGFITNLSLNPEISLVDVKSIQKKPKDNKYLLNIYLVFKDKQSKT